MSSKKAEEDIIKTTSRPKKGAAETHSRETLLASLSQEKTRIT